MKDIIAIVFSLIIFSSCSIQGVYMNRFNNGYGAGWMKVHPDSTFEYIAWDHMTGYGYTKGTWRKVNDSIYLTEFEPKLPSTNRIIEILDDKKNIELVETNGIPLSFNYLKINGVLDSVKSDWDGNYSLKKNDKVKRIEVFDLVNYQAETGQKIADFKTECDSCSYRIIVDMGNIGFKSVFGLETVWLYKNNRLYPISNSSINKSNKGKSVYFKKIDSIEPINNWINSWNTMKKGYE